MYPKYYNGYNQGDPLDANYVYRSIYHDKYYYCPSRLVARKNSKKTPIFLYRLKQTPFLNVYDYYVEDGGNPVTAVDHDV